MAVSVLIVTSARQAPRWVVMPGTMLSDSLPDERVPGVIPRAAPT
jgi:hypothetical protein